MSEMTVRQHLEAIINGHLEPADCFCSDCIIERAEHHARAAIAIFDEANYTRRDGWPTTRYAYIRDPDHPHDRVDA